MAIVFDANAKRIILDQPTVTAVEIYSRWVDWAASGDNLKYGMVVRQVGGDELGGGISIPPYFFLQGDWRVRPMEASHYLDVVGNLFVEGGGSPIVSTLGNFNVLGTRIVPVQAQGYSTSGAGSLTSAEIAQGVWNALAAQHAIDGTMGKQLQSALLNAALAAALSA